MDQERFFNGGYLYLKNIYYKLRLDEICQKISSKYKIKFDLNNILENLIYSRIIFPGSKKYAYETSKKYIESGKFELHLILFLLSLEFLLLVLFFLLILFLLFLELLTFFN